MDKITRILVPINGGAEDEAALQLACSTAKKHGAKINVVVVVEVQRALPLDAALAEQEADAERLLDWAEQYAKQLNCSVRVDMFQSRVAGVTLVDQAIALKADLIIMGLPYRSRFGTYELGETSNYVLNHATCRVWLVRAQFSPVTEGRLAHA